MFQDDSYFCTPIRIDPTMEYFISEYTALLPCYYRAIIVLLTCYYSYMYRKNI